MSVSPSSNLGSLDLDKTKRLMDVADGLVEQRDRQRELVGRLEAVDRDHLREHLRRLYTDLDEEVDDELIDEAIERFLGEEHRFAPPADGLGLALSTLYVRRRRLRARYGRPFMIVAGLVIAIVTGRLVWTEWTTRLEVRRTQSNVTRIFEESRQLEASIARLSEDPRLGELPPPDAARFRDLLAEATAGLSTSEGFFTRYAGDETVSRDDLWEVRFAYDDAAQAISESRGSFDQARDIVALQGELTAAIERIRELDRRLLALAPPERIRASSKALGIQAREALRSRQRDRLREVEQSMSDLIVDTGDLQMLAARLPALRDSAMAVVREASAESRVGELGSRAESLARSASVDELRRTMDELERAVRRLEQAFRIEIVGGVWRYQNDNPSVRNYYLRVRAVDERGNLVPLEVRNEENGRADTVTEWGERVDKAIYDRVAQDKSDNGIIDAAGFGEKKRGFLTVDRLYPDVGQITRW